MVFFQNNILQNSAESRAENVQLRYWQVDGLRVAPPSILKMPSSPNNALRLHEISLGISSRVVFSCSAQSKSNDERRVCLLRQNGASSTPRLGAK
jgi:hypothetical protein